MNRLQKVWRSFFSVKSNATNFLTSGQIEHYQNKGYLVLEKFKNANELRELQKRAREIVEEFDINETKTIFTTDDQVRATDDYFLGSGDKIRFFFEEYAFDKNGKLQVEKHLALNKIGHALHMLEPAFKKFSFDSRFKGIAADLGFRAPVALQSMYIFKQPKIGGKVKPHQDNTFLYTSPPTAMGLWFALEDATQDNGCLWAVPGSHKGRDGKDGEPFSIFKRNPDSKIGGTIFDPPSSLLSTAGAVPLETPAGTLVLLHGNLIHYSDQNYSQASRHAYSIHLVESQNTTYPSFNWLQHSKGGGLEHFPRL